MQLDDRAYRMLYLGLTLFDGAVRNRKGILTHWNSADLAEYKQVCSYLDQKNSWETPVKALEEAKKKGDFCAPGFVEELARLSEMDETQVAELRAYADVAHLIGPTYTRGTIRAFKSADKLIKHFLPLLYNVCFFGGTLSDPKADMSRFVSIEYFPASQDSGTSTVQLSYYGSPAKLILTKYSEGDISCLFSFKDHDLRIFETRDSPGNLDKNEYQQARIGFLLGRCSDKLDYVENGAKLRGEFCKQLLQKPISLSNEALKPILGKWFSGNANYRNDVEKIISDETLGKIHIPENDAYGKFTKTYLGLFSGYNDIYSKLPPFLKQVFDSNLLFLENDIDAVMKGIINAAELSLQWPFNLKDVMDHISANISINIENAVTGSKMDDYLSQLKGAHEDYSGVDVEGILRLNPFPMHLLLNTLNPAIQEKFGQFYCAAKFMQELERGKDMGAILRQLDDVWPKPLVAYAKYRLYDSYLDRCNERIGEIKSKIDDPEKRKPLLDKVEIDLGEIREKIDLDGGYRQRLLDKVRGIQIAIGKSGMWGNVLCALKRLSSEYKNKKVKNIYNRFRDVYNAVKEKDESNAQSDAQLIINTIREISPKPKTYGFDKLGQKGPHPDYLIDVMKPIFKEMGLNLKL